MPDPQFSDQEIIAELHARGVDPNKADSGSGAATTTAPPPAEQPAVSDGDILAELHARGVDPNKASAPAGLAPMPVTPDQIKPLPAFAPTAQAPYHPTTPYAPPTAPYKAPTATAPTTGGFQYDPHAINQAGRDAAAAAKANAQRRQNALTTRINAAWTPAKPAPANDGLSAADHAAIASGVKPAGMSPAYWQRIHGQRPTMPAAYRPSTYEQIATGVLNAPSDAKAVLDGVKALPGVVTEGVGNIAQSLYSGIASKVAEAHGDHNLAKAYADTAEENDNQLRTTLKGILGGDNGVVAKIARAAGYAMGGDRETAAATMQNVYNGIIKETLEHPLQQAVNIAMLGEGGLVLGSARASLLAKAAVNLERASKVAEALGDADRAAKYASQAEAHAQAAESLSAWVKKTQHIVRGGPVTDAAGKVLGAAGSRAAALAPTAAKIVGPDMTRAFGNAKVALSAGQRAVGVIVQSAQKLNPEVGGLSLGDIRAELYQRGALDKAGRVKPAATPTNLDPAGKNVNGYDAGNEGDAAAGPVVVGHGAETPAETPSAPVQAPQEAEGTQTPPAVEAPTETPIQAAPDGPEPFSGPDRRNDPVARQGIEKAIQTWEGLPEPEQKKFLLSLTPDDIHSFVQALHSDRAAGLLNPVSGLPNRVAYNLTEHAPVVAAIDGNGLKQVNDNYGGTVAGDVLLHQIGQVLREHGEHGTPFHYGGDEYAVNFPDQETAERVMPQIQEALRQREMTMPNGKTVRGAGFEYGIASDYDTGETILKKKKDAMKSAPGALDNTGRVKSSLEEKDENGEWQPAANKAATKTQEQHDSAPAEEAPTIDARLVPDFPTEQIHLDPDRFQYKIGYGKGGNSGSLTDAKAWNPDFAGTIAVWRDPADGKAYAVNGHNRRGLAGRLGVPGMDVRFLDAKDAAEARTQGALINIAEGQGTALDAAKLFKEKGYTQADIQKLGVNLKGQKASQGMAIANLNDALFQRTMRGEMPTERAALIGEKLPSHTDQATLMQQIGDRQVTNDDIREMADQIAGGERHTSTTVSLFGEETVTRSLAVERAQVASYINSQLAKDASALDSAGKNADRLAKGNNTIDAETSKRIALASRQGGEVFNKTKNQGGEVSDILNEAAKRMARAKETGEKVDAIKEDALRAFQAHVQEAFKQHGEYKPAEPAAAAGSIFDEPAASGPGSETPTDTAASSVQSTGNTSGKPDKKQAKTAGLIKQDHTVRANIGKGTFSIMDPAGKEVGTFPTRTKAVNQAKRLDANAEKLAGRDAALAEATKAAEAGDLARVNIKLAKASTFEDVSDAQKAAIQKTLRAAIAKKEAAAGDARFIVRQTDFGKHPAWEVYDTKDRIGDRGHGKTAANELAASLNKTEAAKAAAPQTGRVFEHDPFDDLENGKLDEKYGGKDTEEKPAPTRYHGSSGPVEVGYSYDRAQSQNLYGPGFYTTDNLDVARSYTKKGRGGDPHLYKSEWIGKKAPSLIDFDKPLPADVQELFKEYTDQTGDRPGYEVYSDFKGALGDEGLSREEAQERMHGMADEMHKLGYDGIKHVGGKLAGGGKTLHNVEIYFNPKEPAYTQTHPDGKVTGHGGEDNVRLTRIEQETEEPAAPKDVSGFLAEVERGAKLIEKKQPFNATGYAKDIEEIGKYTNEKAQYQTVAVSLHTLGQDLRKAGNPAEADKFTELANQARALGKSEPTDKSEGHVQFIGQWEYFKSADGELLRAKAEDPIQSFGTRHGRFEATAANADASLNQARKAHGLPEEAPAGGDLVMTSPEVQAAKITEPAKRVEAVQNGSLLFADEPRPFMDDERVSGTIHQWIDQAEPKGDGSFVFHGPPMAGNKAMSGKIWENLEHRFERMTADNIGAIFRTEKEGKPVTTWALQSDTHELRVTVNPDKTITVQVSPKKEIEDGMFAPHVTDGKPTADSPVGAAPKMGGARPGMTLADIKAAVTRNVQAATKRIGETPLGDRVAMGKNAFVGNLHMLERHSSPGTVLKARDFAGTNGKVAVEMGAAAGKIIDTMGSTGEFHQFLGALTEGRLRGIRQRWQELTNEALNGAGMIQTKHQGGIHVTVLAPEIEGPLENLAKLGGKYRGVDIEAQRLASNASVANLFAHAQGVDALRDFVAGVFKEAADSTKTVKGMDILPNGADAFDSFTKQPKFKAALKIYKDTMEAEFARSHKQNDGIFSDALGPLDTYYPLTPLEEDGNVQANTAGGQQALPLPSGQFKPKALRGSGGKAEFATPGNTRNAFATGQSDAYDVTPEAFRRAMTSAFRRNAQADLMKTLERDGLLVPADQITIRKVHGRNQSFATFNGKEFPAREVSTGTDKQIIARGKSVFIPGAKMAAPQWLVKELGPMVHKTLPEWGGAAAQLPGQGLINAANGLGVAGLAEPIMHTTNLIGTLVSETPVIGKGLLGKGQLTKGIGALAETIHTDVTSPANLTNMREMARLGLIPERYASETYSAARADTVGSELHRTSFAPALFGENGIDIRARLIMYRAAKIMNGLDPEAPLAMKGTSFADPAKALEIARYVDRLGVYNRALESHIVRFLKDTNLAPFATAGTTMYRNGIRYWLRSLDHKSLPTTGTPLANQVRQKLAQQLTGGAIGLVATWAIMHKAQTGKWPWEDKDSRFLSIPLTDAEKNSAIGKKLYGDQKGKAYVGLGVFNPIGQRGATAIGLRGFYNARHQGASTGLAQEAGLKDALNSASHPIVSGPALKGAIGAVTLSEPYITGIRDKHTGRNSFQLKPVADRIKPGLAGQAEARVEAGAFGVNGGMETLAGNFGMGPKAAEEKHMDPAGRWLKTVVDLAAPRAVQGIQDGTTQARSFRHMDRAANKRVRD